MTLIELMVGTVIFVFVLLSLGSMYLAATRGFGLSSAETTLQRQGTSIEERLVDHVLRARSLQVAECGPASVTISANESIIYQRLVQNSNTFVLEDEFWCVYRHKPLNDPYPQLWRCHIPGLTPPQTCSSTPENLLSGALTPPGQAISVSDSRFEVAPVVGALATTVDIRFDLDLRVVASDQPLLISPRRFGFNTTVRN